MTAPGSPSDYADQFTDAIHALAAQRVAAGKTEKVTPLEAPRRGGEQRRRPDRAAQDSLESQGRRRCADARDHDLGRGEKSTAEKSTPRDRPGRPRRRSRSVSLEADVSVGGLACAARRRPSVAKRSALRRRGRRAEPFTVSPTALPAIAADSTRRPARPARRAIGLHPRFVALRTGADRAVPARHRRRLRHRPCHPCSRRAIVGGGPVRASSGSGDLVLIADEVDARVRARAVASPARSADGSLLALARRALRPSATPAYVGGDAADIAHSTLAGSAIGGSVRIDERSCSSPGSAGTVGASFSTMSRSRCRTTASSALVRARRDCRDRNGAAASPDRTPPPRRRGRAGLARAAVAALVAGGADRPPAVGERAAGRSTSTRCGCAHARAAPAVHFRGVRIDNAAWADRSRPFAALGRRRRSSPG